MKFEDLTVEKVKKMKQEDIFHWGQEFAKMKQEEEIRRILIDYLETRDARQVIS
jgi:hypothetical protein